MFQLLWFKCIVQFTVEYPLPIIVHRRPLMAFHRLNAGGTMQTAMTEEQAQVLRAQVVKEAFDLFDTDGFGEIYCRGKTILELNFVSPVYSKDLLFLSKMFRS